MSLEWPRGALTLPRFQAHRGLWKASHLQENTLASFRAAGYAGAEMIELDVRLSSDGQVVVFHDADLNRIGGMDQLVSDTTFEVLKAKTGCPTLVEVLMDSQVPRLVNVEIKSGEAVDGTLEQAVANVIQLTDSANRVLFSSFNPFSLRRLSKLLPNVPRALLVTEERDKKNYFFLRHMWLRAYARPHLLHIDHRMITADRMQRWRKLGYRIIAWTVNEPDVARVLFEMGVSGIISDSIYSL